MVIIQLDVETVKFHLPDFYLKTTEAYVYLLDRHLVENTDKLSIDSTWSIY